MATPITACPLCKNRQRQFIYRLPEAQGRLNGLFSLWRCQACDLIYVSPQPNPKEQPVLYDDTFYCQPSMRASSLARHIQEFFHDRRRQRVEKFKRPGRLLDIGCGDGTFVRHMAAHGWQATGFDLSPTAQQLARKHNKQAVILSGQWENLKLSPASFDCLTLWQVLEHVADPRQLLRRCNTLLRPGGLLVVAAPNIASLQARITNKRWWGLDVPRHLTHFSPKVLKRALQESGFRVIKINHFSLQYGPYGLFHSLLDYVFTRRHFLSDFTKKTLPAEMTRKERFYNLAALVIFSPLLIPLCLADTLFSPALGRGGFIEAYARRD